MQLNEEKDFYWSIYDTPIPKKGEVLVTNILSG